MHERTEKPLVLMSVTDKTGITEFAGILIECDWEIVSTGGTRKALEEAGIPCLSVETLTGLPEMMDGRLKTLHHRIAGGIIFDRSKERHVKDAHHHMMRPIDMVVVNLYNFAGAPSIEQIDIGGPNMLRIAAKNCEHVIPVCCPSFYGEIGRILRNRQPISLELRQRYAAKVFHQTAAYDAMIADHFDRCLSSGRLVEKGSH